MRPNVRIVVLLLAILLSAAELRAEERWYVFSIGGTPVGYVSEEADGMRTRTVVFARLTRLGKSIEMRFDTTTVEDAAGALQVLAYEALLSKQPMRLDARVDGDRVRILTAAGGAAGSGGSERILERGPAPLLGPAAIAVRSAKELRTGGAEIAYAVFSPELQRVARVRRRAIAMGDRVECANTVATKIEETIDGMPTPRTVWIAGDGSTVADSVSGPFGPMTTCRATKEAALAANGTLPADLYERTVARSNVRFADSGAIDRLVVRIVAREPGHRLPEFGAHNQRVVEPGVVEIVRPSRRPQPDAGPAAPEFLASNAIVESTHPEIVRLAKELARASAIDTAMALTKWTAENLSMDAGIVMAPASELIRDRKATCMGYATLLAALARAAGLPSRVVMGYVYYGGIWGGHAWTDIRVDGQWLPFDAAVFSPGVASAARLSVGASSFADGGGSLMGSLGALFGKVDVQTIEYEAGGRSIRATPPDAPFHVVGSTYVNPGLGVRVRADGWSIERTSSTWPSTLVVAFRRGETIIELHQRPRYPERPLPGDADATIASPYGSTLFVWTARGTGAQDALRSFLTRVERVE